MSKLLAVYDEDGRLMFSGYVKDVSPYIFDDDYVSYTMTATIHG
jgi:hypothetical protein